MLLSIEDSPQLEAKTLYDPSSPSDIATDGYISVGHFFMEVLEIISENVEKNYRMFGESPDSFAPERKLQKYQGFSMSYQCRKYKDEIEFIERCHYDEYSITVRKHGPDKYSIEKVYPSH